VNASQRKAAVKSVAAKRKPKAVPKPAKSLTDLPEPELRAKLLATPTLSDKSWAPALGKPARDKGEARTAYIERVLAAE
jgi:hypothetical protein